MNPNETYDSEDEDHPAAMRTSFSGSFDTAHTKGLEVDEDMIEQQQQMKRSRSEFYRGECITLDSNLMDHGKYDAANAVNVAVQHEQFTNYGFKEGDENDGDSDHEYVKKAGTELTPNGKLVSDVRSLRIATGDSFEKSPEVSCSKASKCSEGVFRNALPVDLKKNIKFSKPCNDGYVNIDYDRLPYIRNRSPELDGSYKKNSSSVSPASLYDGKGDARVNNVKTTNDAIDSGVFHRSVADIRNNIPIVDTAGHYNGTDSVPVRVPSCNSQLHIELTQLSKRSPGVAHRLPEATTPSKGDSTEFNKESPHQFANDKTNLGMQKKNDHAAVELIVSEQVSLSECSSLSDQANDHQTYSEQIAGGQFQTANSMFQKCLSGFSNDEMRVNVDPFCYSDVLRNAILFDSFDDCTTDDRTYTLSPDPTECDSDDAYGEANDDDREKENDIQLPTVLPAVEDGLSGDDDDMAGQRHMFHPEVSNDVMESGFYDSHFLSDSDVVEFFSDSVAGVNAEADGACQSLHEEKVEQAIRDIYLAMERSKTAAGGGKDDSSSASRTDRVLQTDTDPVWVVQSSDSSVLSDLHDDAAHRTGRSARHMSSTRVTSDSVHIGSSDQSVETSGNGPKLAATTSADDAFYQADIEQHGLLQKYLDRFAGGGGRYSAVPYDDREVPHRYNNALDGGIAKSSNTNGCSAGQKPIRPSDLRPNRMGRNMAKFASGNLEQDHDSELSQFHHRHHRNMHSDEAPCGHYSHCHGDHHLIADDLENPARHYEEIAYAGDSAPNGDCHYETAYSHKSRGDCGGGSSSSSFVSRNRRCTRRFSSSASETDVCFDDVADYNTDDETDELLDRQYNLADKTDACDNSLTISDAVTGQLKKSQPREALLPDSDNRTILIEGVLFRTRYLGSTKIVSEGNPSKAKRMMQAQEAVGRIKAPDDDSQPSTEVDLFVSAEKIMVLDTGHREVIMDHALQTISYIADIGDLLVIMVRLAVRVVANQMAASSSTGNGSVPSASAADDDERRRRRVTICCHVFESDEAQLIAQSIGQAFQVAYAEFLKANGIEDPNLLKDVDYQEVLNQQQIFGEELSLFSSKEKQKEVKVIKQKGEPLGIVLVESGWGSMLPTVVLANLMPSGPAAKTGRLNIGDQILSIDGNSLIGLPLSACQNFVKATRHQTVVRLKVVSCAPVVEVLIKRPHVKYQLGFSVQNGVICSLLRGGIGERGGIRVGHRIIEINGISMVAVPHEKIVHLLATSVGEIHMKTMQTSVFRLLTGQDIPHYI